MKTHPTLAHLQTFEGAKHLKAVLRIYLAADRADGAQRRDLLKEASDEKQAMRRAEAMADMPLARVAGRRGAASGGRPVGQDLRGSPKASSGDPERCFA